ncbi:PEPxxWA-CTERM sorting domain-containing protein [Sphingomonas floccifaciens]|uniref:PEPxxWA-CTERM sorting domain-containing protein n=1 Tax=Sphingomonas floccifaciens TaxID=1844115 RepID=A0ABW4NE30_9SPHN
MKLASIACAAVAVAVATPASAAVYTFNTSVGAGSATGSITTDDTIGVLSGANITAFNILINDGADSFTVTNNNGSVLIGGNALTATSTGLSFDFSAQGANYALFQNPFPGSSVNYFCLQTVGCYFPAEAGIGIRLQGELLNSSLSGNVQFAQAAAAAVPEPATWAMMLIGFGGIGASMRRRKQVAAVNFA